MAGKKVNLGYSSRIWSERWRLGMLERHELCQVALVAMIVGLLYMLFHLFGNMVGDVNSRSAFVWMVARWSDKISFGADYSHGKLIPFVSIWACWWKRDLLIKAEKKSNKYGLWVIVGALLMHWLGAKIQQTRLSLMSLILMIWGVPLYLWGWQVAKVLIFPCAYLIFCVPLNFLDSLAFPLRMISAKLATITLNVIGIDAMQRGSAIHVGPGYGIPLDVADPCSGLRSLLAMTALTAVYAYCTQKTLIKKWLLFMCSIPLAVFGNIARITTIAVMSQAVGREIALGVYHDFSGYILFAVSIVMMVALGTLFNLGFREQFKKWKAKVSDLTS